MINAIVACCVVLTLASMYYLARSSARGSRHEPSQRLRRLCTIAIKRAARRHEQWLTARELERRH